MVLRTTVIARITERPHAFGTEEGTGKEVYISAQVVRLVQDETGLRTGKVSITGMTVPNRRPETGVKLAMLEHGFESAEIVESDIAAVGQGDGEVSGRHGQVAVVIPSKKHGAQSPWGADRLRGWCRDGSEVTITREPAIAVIDLADGRPGVIAINAVLWRKRKGDADGPKWIISKVQQVVDRLSTVEERSMIVAAGVARGQDFY